MEASYKNPDAEGTVWYPAIIQKVDTTVDGSKAFHVLFIGTSTRTRLCARCSAHVSLACSVTNAHSLPQLVADCPNPVM